MEQDIIASQHLNIPCVPYISHVLCIWCTRLSGVRWMHRQRCRKKQRINKNLYVVTGLNPNMDNPNSWIIRSPVEAIHLNLHNAILHALFEIHTIWKNFAWYCLFGLSGTQLYGSLTEWISSVLSQTFAFWQRHVRNYVRERERENGNCKSTENATTNLKSFTRNLHVIVQWWTRSFEYLSTCSCHRKLCFAKANIR